MSLAAKSRSTSSLKLPLLIVAHDPTTPAAPEGVLRAARGTVRDTREFVEFQVGSNARRPDRPTVRNFRASGRFRPEIFWVVNGVA